MEQRALDILKKHFPEVKDGDYMYYTSRSSQKFYYIWSLYPYTKSVIWLTDKNNGEIIKDATYRELSGNPPTSCHTENEGYHIISNMGRGIYRPSIHSEKSGVYNNNIIYNIVSYYFDSRLFENVAPIKWSEIDDYYNAPDDDVFKKLNINFKYSHMSRGKCNQKIYMNCDYDFQCLILYNVGYLSLIVIEVINTDTMENITNCVDEIKLIVGGQTQEILYKISDNKKYITFRLNSFCFYPCDCVRLNFKNINRFTNIEINALQYY